MPKRRSFLILFSILYFFVVGCGPAGPSAAEVARAIETHLRSAGESAAVGKEPRIEPKAVVRFYRARSDRPAWDWHKGKQIVEAIRGVYADGLDPADYHLRT